MAPVRLLVLGLAPLLMAAAPEIPNLDVKSTCHASGSLQNQAEDACMKDELSAKDELGRMWSRVPASIKDTCASEVKIGGSPSYVELLTCAQMNEWSKTPADTTASDATGARKP